MHPSVREFVASRVAEHDLAAGDCLEIGSYDVNGGIRDLFTGTYVGVDLRPGPGVDQVIEPGRLPWPRNAFDVVVSAEMLEHDERPWESMLEMGRVLRYGGRLLVTCRGYDGRGCFPVHDYPSDFWRFSEGAMRVLAGAAALDVVDVQADPEVPGWFLEATKEAVAPCPS